MTEYEQEPCRLINASLSDLMEHGGPITYSLAAKVSNAGIVVSCLETLTFDVRCDLLAKGEVQHTRSAWHKDGSDFTWAYHSGVAPTEFRKGKSKWGILPETLTWYGRIEHRCPPAPEDGWRYFCRIGYVERRGHFRHIPRTP